MSALLYKTRTVSIPDVLVVRIDTHRITGAHRYAISPASSDQPHFVTVDARTADAAHWWTRDQALALLGGTPC
jgi:hypothetical protein